MVITITCPSCSASFPVDPAKIPEGGVNARCSSCGDVLRVERPAVPEPLSPLEEVALPEPPSAAPEVAEDPVQAQPTSPPIPEVAAVEAEPEPEVADPLPGLAEPTVDEPAAESAPIAQPAEPAPTEPVAAEPAPAATEPTSADPFAEPAPFEPAPAAPATPEPPVKGFTFGKRDPTDKARRLARVLVSDMIMYNAERHQSALAAGTLVQDFEEEIEKSWKEFVEQVGADLANGEGRDFWTQALNDILAKGQEVF